MLPLAGTATPIAFQHTRAFEGYAQFSPDAKWIAFQSDESGASEVYVAPFPGPGRRERVSNNGGSNPVGTAMEGTFLPLTGAATVDVKTAAGTFDASEPKPLFELSEPWTGRWRYGRVA